MKKNIWSKLGANSTTFRPELHRDTLSPPLEMGYRLSIGHGEKSIKQGPIILGQPAEHTLGGIGLFSTPTDYMKFLSSLLGGGYPLLSESSIEILFQPQLSEASRMAMPKPLGSQMRRVLGIKCLDDHTQADHCLAGTMTLKDIPGRRRAGTVNWSGLPNLHWVRSSCYIILFFAFARSHGIQSIFIGYCILTYDSGSTVRQGSQLLFLPNLCRPGMQLLLAFWLS